MNDLVLRLRLEALRRNLEQVRGIMASVRSRRAEIEDLYKKVSSPENSIWASVSKLDALLRGAKRKLVLEAGQREGDTLETIVSELDSGLEEIEALDKRLGETRKLLNAMLKRSGVEFDKEKLDESLERIFVSESDDTIQEIREVEQKLARIRRADVPSSATEAVKEAWDSYATMLEEHGGPLFTEYVDFLGGLALRDSGCDAGICQMADELIRRCNLVGDRPLWHSLTIPTRAEAMKKTLARIIRLGFPEWTLWAVPLGAHEFGHLVVVENDHLLEREPDDEPFEPGERYLAHYLADAFATFALGPAYACAAILLRFDALHPYQEELGRTSDAKRAHVVLAMLDLMNEDDPDLLAYTDIIGLLRESWEAALAQVQPPGEFDRAEREWLERRISRMWKFLQQRARSVKYGAKRWEAVKANYQHLRREGGADNIEPGALEELRDVLNAAWLCRAMHPDETERIRDEAERLWASISGGSPRPPKPDKPLTQASAVS